MDLTRRTMNTRVVQNFLKTTICSKNLPYVFFKLELKLAYTELFVKMNTDNYFSHLLPLTDMLQCGRSEEAPIMS